ncbi:hypothetical protein [Amycolatopsis azurea]|uniref:Uncharacterized protein n=1 Tax=Amycolatopsis azurea DSM 43854 TaxID=1238180 RepID=M2PUI6_9PSEU|nr:hypothetical protein [Amycolatopsis azurea]EMD28283.1 hypothetical protein C791_1282 [Amycolatopsis azurea DSM 43854]
MRWTPATAADGRGSCPVILATYEIVCSKYADPEVTEVAKAIA